MIYNSTTKLLKIERCNQIIKINDWLVPLISIIIIVNNNIHKRKKFKKNKDSKYVKEFIDTGRVGYYQIFTHPEFFT